MDLFQELIALTAALDAAGVPYALAGGLALAVHGAPRATKDIDLLVLATDVERAVDAAHRAGFTFVAQPMVFQDGVEVRRVTRILGGDSLTLDFLVVNANLEPAWASARTIVTEGGNVRVISREALIAMKVAAGRTRDLADVEMLRDLDR